MPSTIGLFGSFVSATVDSVTWPEKAWLRPTRKLPPLVTVPVAGSATRGGVPSVKSGIAITWPG